MMGFQMFTLYMRWFLSPMAVYTWANLNHTLYGTDSDPFFVAFDLGKWYWLAAEVYLCAATFAAFLGNSLICYIGVRLICGQKSK